MEGGEDMVSMTIDGIYVPEEGKKKRELFSTCSTCFFESSCKEIR